MAYLLICVRTDDTILDRAVFSKDLAPVKFDTSEIGLAFRHDPCTNSAQYFVIHGIPEPPRNQQAIGKNDKSGTSQRRDTRTGTSPSCSCNNDTITKGPCKVCDIQLVPKFSLVLLDISYKLVTKLKSDVAYSSFREVVHSKQFREGFINFVRKRSKLKDVRHNVCTCENVYEACSLSINLPRLVEVHLEPALANISHAWSDRLGVLVKKRMVLEETMAWLSTLGGGYSSLGDYFQHFSEEAARISVTQLQIAMEMGDPVMAAKCRLFYALSLMQRGQLQKTKIFIKEQYHFATHFKVRDQRLIDMCKGMWSKLQYLYAQKKKRKLFTTTSKTQNLATDSGKDGTLMVLDESRFQCFRRRPEEFVSTSSVLMSGNEKLENTSKDGLVETCSLQVKS